MFAHRTSQSALLLVLLCWTISAAAPAGSDSDETIRMAFTDSHEGWSCDEVLLNDQRRKRFTERCRSLGIAPTCLTNDEICSVLLRLRKRGGILPTATKRAQRLDLDDLVPMAEISARRLHDELGRHTDSLLVSSVCRKLFDSIAESIDPGCDKYLVRKAALRLRKSRQLRPELLSRVTDWKREIKEYSVKQLAKDQSLIPNRSGVYIFRDSTGYLYIGQASDLRKRLGNHLGGSDRPALAQYLNSNYENIQIEMHIFASDSPGAELLVRRAYESELIRTRKPKLNLAP